MAFMMFIDGAQQGGVAIRQGDLHAAGAVLGKPGDGIKGQGLLVGFDHQLVDRVIVAFAIR